MHVEYIKKIAERYSGLGYPLYSRVRNEDTPPWQPLKKPLSRCRVALCASGGIYRAGQLAFHFRDDNSFRQIPGEVRVKDLRITHFAYDMTDARRDPNCLFPIDSLRRLWKRIESGTKNYGRQKNNPAHDRESPHGCPSLPPGKWGGLTLLGHTEEGFSRNGRS